MGGQEAFRHIVINLSFHFTGRIVKDYSVIILQKHFNFIKTVLLAFNLS